MANRLRISEALKEYNTKARKAGKPKLSLAKLVPHVFDKEEDIAEATGTNYLSMWNTSLDPEPGRKLVHPKAVHLSRIADTLGVPLDNLVERE